MTTPLPVNQADLLAQLGPIAQAVLTDDVFTAVGLPTLPDDEKAELYRTMVATVQDRILARILDLLDDAQREQLLALLDRPDGDQVERFVREHVPDLDAITNEEALLYKAEMVQNARHIRSVLGIRDEPASTAAEQPPANNLPAVVGEELPAVIEQPPTPPAVYHPDNNQVTSRLPEGY